MEAMIHIDRDRVDARLTAIANHAGRNLRPELRLMSLLALEDMAARRIT
jgi:hypothetical protein